MSRQSYEIASLPEPRRRRLAAARGWAAGYTGKHIVRDYRKRFNVTFLRAYEDLQLLGIPVGARETALAVRRKEQHLRAEPKAPGRRRRDRSEDSEPLFEQALEYGIAFVVGYTEGGMPYGLTVEEWEQAQADDTITRNEAEPEDNHWDIEAEPDDDCWDIEADYEEGVLPGVSPF